MMAHENCDGRCPHGDDAGRLRCHCECEECGGSEACNCDFCKLINPAEEV